MYDQTHAAGAPSKRFSFDTASIWVLAVTGLLATVAFMPFGAFPFLYTKVSILAAGGLVALMLFILARLTRGNVIVPPITLVGAMWLVPLAYAISTLFSSAGVMHSFFGSQLEADTFGFMLILASLGTLAALVLRRVDQYQSFFKIALITFAIVLVSEVVILFLAKVSPTTISATSNIVGSFSDLGMMAGLGIITSLLAIRFLALGKRMRIFLWILIAVGLFAVAVVNAVFVWALIALTALGLFIEAIMRRGPVSDEADLEGVTTLDADFEPVSGNLDGKSLVAPLVTLVIALFFLIGSATIGSALSTAMGANYLDVRPSWQSTFDVGSHTYASSPIFGSGPATFSTQWLKFRDRALNETVFWNVDFVSGIGLIPTSFVTTGALGALAWLSFIGLFLWIGLRSLLFRAPEDSFARFVSIASFTGALYVFVLMTFSVPGPAVLAAGFLMVGVFISSLRHGKGRHEWGIIFSRNPRVGFVVVFALTLLLLASVVAAYAVVNRYLAEIAYVEGAQALSANNLEAAEQATERALLFAPSDRAYQLLATVGMARMNQVANDTSLPAAERQQRFQTALSSSIDAAITATRLRADSYQNWTLLGNVYQAVVPLDIDGAYENAKTAYLRALELNPTNPTLPYILAQLEIANEQPAAAEEYLMQAIALKQDYTQAIFLLSQLQVAQGKASEALQAAESAAFFAPNDPVVLFQLGILRSGTGDTQGAIAALARAVELNPQYANARFFLGVAYALAGQFPAAVEQLETVASLSPENAQAVAEDLAMLRQNRNPYPASRLGALGIPQVPVTDTTTQPQGARTQPSTQSTTTPATR
ncbi:MAG TPA: tetratricopeptide repeat protein [Candidatus Paceibacterota bacterium]|nr:tetratricopeptide repeat protein [Candidatus Paceibacterota bacterium]